MSGAPALGALLETKFSIPRRPRTLVARPRLHALLDAGVRASGAAGGALWGGLIGLVFLMPLLGAAIGGATGAAAGSMTDVGVDDQFMKQLGEKLQPGGAALFVLVRQSTPDKVLPRISQHGGDVIHSSLSEDAEETLREALREGAHA